MGRVSLFSAQDLPAAPSMQVMIEALHPAHSHDLRFTHAAAADVSQVPSGQRRGVNIFGPGVSPRMEASALGQSRMREVSSVLLNNAGYESNSLTVYDRDLRLFTDGILNLDAPRALANFDPEFHLDQDGELYQADDWLARATYIDCIALPVCGLGFKNYGHFLYDGLPGVFLHSQMLDMNAARIVGQRLQPWQRDILAALGLDKHYMELKGHAVFRKLLTTTLLSMHVAYPTGFIRGMFDRIRFQFGLSSETPNRLVYLARGGDTSRRVLRNREEIETLMASLGFEVVQAERLPFGEQVQLLASCRVVVGESGAAMANLGFSQPGTRVLEIQPELFVEGWIRGMCFILSHPWHVYFAEVDSPQPDGTFSYRIDPDDLAAAVRLVVAGS